MQHEQHRVPVTALAFWDNHVVLAGEGTLLKAYDAHQKTLLAAVQVFDGQAIHGILVSEDDQGSIFIWGGQIVCHVRIARDVSGVINFEVGPKAQANDWILDAAFREHSQDGPTRIALLTAHNALVLATLSDPLKLELEPLVPGSNCILYCAHVTWLSGSQCLIASGTAFGDVIIWSCQVSEEEGQLSARTETHYTFSAHEGSVFGVQISSSSLASKLDDRQRVLATCSDDRSIRLWDISDLSVESPSLTEQQRQTGFGSSQSEDVHAPPLLSKVIGHISRIWHVRLVEDAKTDQVYLLSFGEDASSIKWSIEANAKTPNDLQPFYSLKQDNAQKPHNGKNIWSLAVSSMNDIVTGGADGAIALQCFLHENASVRTIEPPNGEYVGIYRAYGFTGGSQMIASTDQGQLHSVTVGISGDSDITKISDNLPRLRGYSVISSVSGLAFAGGSNGTVYVCHADTRKVDILVETGGKVAGLFAVVAPPGSHHIALLVTNMGKSTARLYQLEHSDQDGKLTVARERELSLSSGFVVTSFAAANEANQVFLGSRNGAVALYNTAVDETESRVGHWLLIPATHENETVTSLHASFSEHRPQTVHLISTGRDGTYAIHRVPLVGREGDVKATHLLSLPFGPNIEGQGFCPEGHLWIWGFRSTQFVVFDIETQQEVMTVECGGAHRIWTFQIDSNGGTFVWTKASKLYVKTQSQLPYQLTALGSHGREIKCSAISPINSRLIATGAEDTDIKLSIFEDGSFRCLHTLQKHNTGIQHLQWSNDGEYLISSGGFEELFVWKINQNVPHIEIGVVCESRHPRSGTSDLRILHFDVQDSTADDENNMKANAFDITAAYSDSTLRSWRYKLQDRTWILLAAGDYLTSCLTQSMHLHLHPPSTFSTSRFGILTASTDGHLAVWRKSSEKESSLLEWHDRHQVHQNSILALISCNLSVPNEQARQARLVITGGDDNAIGITRVTESEAVCCFRTLLVSRAHAAAVTALGIVATSSIGNNHRLWLVSASIDQRIKLWRIDTDLEKDGVDGVDVKLVENVFTSVADVSSMEAIQLAGDESGVLVCGVGLDVWKIGRRVLE